MDTDCYFGHTSAMDNKLLPFLLACVLLTGCARSHRELSQSDGPLISAYAELILAREEFRRQSPPVDSLAYQERVQRILSAYNLTREELEQRFSELAQSQESFRDFQSKVREELEKSRPQSLPAL